MPTTRHVRTRLEKEDSDRYSRFRVAENEIHKLLEFSQGGAHISFTPHGLSHITSVELAYDWLLSDEDIESLNPTECYCLLLATILHDALMIPRRPGDEQRARQTHAQKPYDFLVTNSRRLAINQHEAHAIAEVIRAHGVYDLSEIDERTVLGSSAVNLRKLGACLSMADICNADESRAPQIVFDYLSLDDESASHWRLHLQIGGITRQGDRLVMSALVFSEQGREAVESYADAIRQQLAIVKPYFHSSLQPIVGIDVDVKRLSSPVDQKLEFKTDMGAILKILIEGVYERPDVFIRELVQNALDATYLNRAQAIRRNEQYEPAYRCY